MRDSSRIISCWWVGDEEKESTKFATSVSIGCSWNLLKYLHNFLGVWAWMGSHENDPYENQKKNCIKRWKKKNGEGFTLGLGNLRFRQQSELLSHQYSSSSFCHIFRYTTYSKIANEGLSARGFQFSKMHPMH